MPSGSNARVEATPGPRSKVPRNESPAESPMALSDMTAEFLITQTPVSHIDKLVKSAEAKYGENWWENPPPALSPSPDFPARTTLPAMSQQKSFSMAPLPNLIDYFSILTNEDDGSGSKNDSSAPGQPSELPSASHQSTA
ncbi:hypothetical protein QFC22_005855 [Naganishia vaughanmartiniae]|uniref:Uncharacterized protein n=1 Tax=Naganishia vaughanmartiniae TaxID=1424756 RepID=A0ACC2WRU0_9TREE|nr:hypothetical protein QFC22_005855 [Naganishia vaughanmartiniae]